MDKIQSSVLLPWPYDHQVTSAAWEIGSLYIGTSSGHIYKFNSSDLRKTILEIPRATTKSTSSPISSMFITNSYLLIFSDKTIYSVSKGLTAPPKVEVKSVAAICQKLQSTQPNSLNNKIKYFAVASTESISLYQFDQYLEFVKVIPISSTHVISLVWINNSIAYVSKTGYYTVNINTFTENIISDVMEEGHLLAVSSCINDEIMIVCQNNIGIFYDIKTDKLSNRNTIPWKPELVQIGSHPPYIFGVTSNGAVEIYSIRTQKLYQTLHVGNFKRLIFLQEHQFVISTTDTALFGFYSGDYHEQLLNLFNLYKVKEAHELFNIYTEHNDTYEAEFKLFHLSAGLVYFNNLEFARSFQHFTLGPPNLDYLTNFWSSYIYKVDYELDMPYGFDALAAKPQPIDEFISSKVKEKEKDNVNDIRLLANRCLSSFLMERRKHIQDKEQLKRVDTLCFILLSESNDERYQLFCHPDRFINHVDPDIAHDFLIKINRRDIVAQLLFGFKDYLRSSEIISTIEMNRLNMEILYKCIIELTDSIDRLSSIRSSSMESSHKELKLRIEQYLALLLKNVKLNVDLVISAFRYQGIFYIFGIDELLAILNNAKAVDDSSHISNVITNFLEAFTSSDVSSPGKESILASHYLSNAIKGQKKDIDQLLAYIENNVSQLGEWMSKVRSNQIVDFSKIKPSTFQYEILNIASNGILSKHVESYKDIIKLNVKFIESLGFQSKDIMLEAYSLCYYIEPTGKKPFLTNRNYWVEMAVMPLKLAFKPDQNEPIFHELLKILLDEGMFDFGEKLLNKYARTQVFDPIQVLDILPDNMELSRVSKYFLHAYRTGIGYTNRSKIQLGLELCNEGCLPYFIWGFIHIMVNLNDSVMVYGYKGTVRFISPSLPSLIGIELEAPRPGYYDGYYHGQLLFNCKPSSAVYCSPQSIMNYSVEEAACILIQRFVRGFCTRILYIKLIAFYFINELESYHEQITLKHYKDVAIPFLQDIHRRIGSASNSADYDTDISMSPIDMNTAQDFNIMDLDICIYGDTLFPDYNGPALGDKVTMKFALELYDCYLRGVAVSLCLTQLELPIEYAQKILFDTAKLMEKLYEGSLLRLSLPTNESSRLIVVGDTHGQLQDVLWIFYKFGPPSANNVYLFNGDIADRGLYSSNIFLLLFAFKLACPESVHINRGNHESDDMNEMYGFAKEVRSKYDGNVYRLFQNIFWLLPLATVIEDKVIVLHGGLFRYSNVTLENIDNANRKRTCPATPATFDDSIVFDILWSDPRVEDGIGRSSRGVDCITFGPDITKRFLEANNLEVCIRSHQVPSNLRGFEATHDGTCFTLFSASNYRGITQNYAAVFIFGPSLTFEVEEFMAPSLEIIRNQSSSTHDITEKIISTFKAREIEMRASSSSPHNFNIRKECIRDILCKISEYVCNHKDKLWKYFYTRSQGTYITPSIWRDGLESATGIKLPWVFGTRLLNAIEDNGLIDYNKILCRFVIGFFPQNRPHSKLQKECITQIFETMIRSDLSLKETLLVFDRNLDGVISYFELDEIIRKFNIGLSNPQVKILMRTILSSCIEDNQATKKHADIAEFLGKLKVIYSKTIDYSPEEEWMLVALPEIGRALLFDKTEAAKRYYNVSRITEAVNKAISSSVDITRRRSSAIRAVALCQIFQELDEIESGYLSYDNFVKAIMNLDLTEAHQRLGFRLREEHVYKIAKMIDVSNTNKINYLEFLQAFYIVDRSKYSVADELWSHICSCLYKYHCSLRHALHSYDIKRTGKVHTIDFKEALHSLNSVLGENDALFTHDQIDLLVDCIDTDEEGLIEYDEFLDCFQPTYMGSSDWDGANTSV